MMPRLNFTGTMRHQNAGDPSRTAASAVATFAVAAVRAWSSRAGRAGALAPPFSGRAATTLLVGSKVAVASFGSFPTKSGTRVWGGSAGRRLSLSLSRPISL